jgi:hypothetical protein
MVLPDLFSNTSVLDISLGNVRGTGAFVSRTRWLPPQQRVHRSQYPSFWSPVLSVFNPLSPICWSFTRINAHHALLSACMVGVYARRTCICMWYMLGEYARRTCIYAWLLKKRNITNGIIRMSTCISMRVCIFSEPRESACVCMPCIVFE